MTKITLAVCKVFKNSGSLRFHRDKTKKHWKHYFLDLEEEKFKTEWVSTLQALILKRRVYKKLKFICPKCGLIFEGLVKKDSDSAECPECET